MILSKIHCFPDDKFNKRVANFLKKKISDSKNIVITAGKTVKPIYKILDKYNFEKKNIYLSDERIVPYSSNLSNYKNLKNYNFIKKNKFIHFNIENRFSKIRSKEYFKSISKIKILDFSILSLGKNCHVASIFFKKNTKSNQVYFFYKYRRISISLKILARSKEIIIICNKKQRAAELAKNIKNKKKGFKFFNNQKTIFLFGKTSCTNFFRNIGV